MMVPWIVSRFQIASNTQMFDRFQFVALRMEQGKNEKLTMPTAICSWTCVRSVLHIHLNLQTCSKIINLPLHSLPTCFNHFFYNIQSLHLKRSALLNPVVNMRISCCFFWCIFATDMNITKQCVQLSQPKNDREKMFWGTIGQAQHRTDTAVVQLQLGTSGIVQF